MPVQTTVGNVPGEVREELTGCATRQRQSTQESLRGDRDETAAQPSLSAWLEEVGERSEVARRGVPASVILEARDADRK